MVLNHRVDVKYQGAMHGNHMHPSSLNFGELLRVVGVAVHWHSGSPSAVSARLSLNFSIHFSWFLFIPEYIFHFPFLLGPKVTKYRSQQKERNRSKDEK